MTEIGREFRQFIEAGANRGARLRRRPDKMDDRRCRPHCGENPRLKSAKLPRPRVVAHRDVVETNDSLDRPAGSDLRGRKPFQPEQCFTRFRTVAGERFMTDPIKPDQRPLKDNRGEIPEGQTAIVREIKTKGFRDQLNPPPEDPCSGVLERRLTVRPLRTEGVDS